MKSRAFLSLSLLCLISASVVAGCGGVSETSGQRAEEKEITGGRRPTKSEHANGVAVAYEFSREELKLSEEQMENLVPDVGQVNPSKKVLAIQFFNPDRFDPETHAPTGLFIAISGGFPDYFTVSIDMTEWRVVSHYASSR